MADVRTPELVINKLTKQQYENIQNPSPTELYLVPEDEEHKPICYPTTASEVGTTSMLVKSSVSDNGRMLTENGFVYNTSGNPTISDTKVICDLGVGFMEKTLENLTMNTEYHIKSYGQNASGISYGSELVRSTSNNPIPVEYQLVEWLSNNGNTTQKLILYGILDIDNNSNFRKYDFYVKNVNGSGSGFFFGTLGNNLGWWEAWNGSSSSGAAVNVPITEDFIKFTVDLQVTKCYINDNLVYLLSSSYNRLDTPLCLYRRSDNWQMGWINGQVQKIIVYGGTMADRVDFALYPVYRIFDNKPGMYDIVNNVFYTNQGTGEFTVGPDKVWEE